MFSHATYNKEVSQNTFIGELNGTAVDSIDFRFLLRSLLHFMSYQKFRIDNQGKIQCPGTHLIRAGGGMGGGGGEGVG